jgi:hypothetical protein
MFKWLIYWYEEWKFEREFQKKKKELIKLDPFIYKVSEDEKN